ncbi:GIY-YIG nuclease family protein, partial [Klebsiella pneumoniae]
MKLFDYLKMEFPGLTPEDTKVHLAQINDYKEDPLVKFRAETFDEWQCWQKRLEFNRRYVVSLIRIPGTETWLFAGAFQQKGNAGKKAYPGREELY